MRVYIAGPMTGVPLYNFPLFEEVSGILKAMHHEPVSPADHDIAMGWVAVGRASDGTITEVNKTEGFDWNVALADDERLIDSCDAIYLLPGWTRSRGAVREFKRARATGKVIMGRAPERIQADEFPADPEVQPLVGLVGYAQSGKDTFAGMLGYQRLAFADPLKELALACKPQFEVPDWTEEAGEYVYSRLGPIVDEHGWEYAKAEVPGVREFLQNLGVGVRDILGADTWVNAALAKYDPNKATIVTDVRFPNEIDAIRDRGGVIVRIDRIGNEPVNAHVSEFAWQATDPDYRIIAAPGDLDTLRAEARHLDLILRGQASVVTS